MTMTSDRWQHVKNLLQQALEVEPAQRPSFLEQICGDDAELRAELDELLLHESDDMGSSFDTAAIDERVLAVSELKSDTRIGRRIGAYQLIEEIGVGGMGEVYSAFRADDQYRKQVAIKLVRAGQDSKFVVDRFKHERQMLASLDHPNIARLLDGGTTEDGVPYFVMELIEGRPITEYCDALHLSTEDRLRLFLQVCSAVQYAHQRLIVHRDLKPSNILVTQDGTPKLLDFGIAKVLDPENGQGLDLTLSMFRLFTPGYASPEQVKNEPITTASDVYSLGVLLFELLTGNKPYRTTGDAAHEIVRAICEVEAIKPSSAVWQRNTSEPSAVVPDGVDLGSPAKISRALKGDLDNIVLTALRKEPERRYATAEQFTADIKRYLGNQPVSASGDSLSYRASKFVRRNKAGVGAAVVMTLVLAAGISATLYEAHRARVQQLRAEQRFNDVRELANSLMFDVHDSIQNLPGSTPARKLLVERALRYLDKLSQESGSDVSLQRELAAAYLKLARVQGANTGSNLGDTASAVQSFRKAAALREQIARQNPDNVQDQQALAQACADMNNALWYAGEKHDFDYFQKSIQIRETLVAQHPTDLALISDLASSYRDLGAKFTTNNRLQEGLDQYRKSLLLFQQVANATPEDRTRKRNLSYAHKRVAGALAALGKLDEALQQDQIALNLDKELIAAEPQNAQFRYDITFAYGDTGYTLGKQGHLDAALDSYYQALDIRKQLAVADPKDAKVRGGMARTYGYISDLLEQKGQLQKALSAAREGLKIRENLVATDPANNGWRKDLARSQADVGFTSAALAARMRPGSNREQMWQDAQSYLERSLPVWKEMENNGELAGDEVGKPEKIAEEVAKCKARRA